LVEHNATSLPASTPAITLRSVTKSYGKVNALSGVELVVGQGELYGFLGPNGAGKTTAIRILTGFIRANQGNAQLFGLDAWHHSVALKRRIGFIPDSASVYGNQTGQQFLDYLGRLHGYTTPPLQLELLDRLQLSDVALRRKLRGYSQGMKQKVMLVQAMQHDPELLIMDEPTEALDPLMRQVFFSLMREFRERGRTVFFSSHVLADVEEVCERVAIIRDGKTVSTGSVDELRAGHPRTMVVEFRQPPTNGLRAAGVAVVSREGNIWRLAVSGDINPLLQELATYDLEDLVFGQTTLEELFMGFYQGKNTSG
jgi:ABC-2 type transport system ATP-binding protein